MAERKYRFVSIIMFILRPDAPSLNGSVMINQSNQSIILSSRIVVWSLVTLE